MVDSRQPAKYSIRIHSAEHLCYALQKRSTLIGPSRTSTVTTTSANQNIPAFVQVCFAGKTGKTSVKANFTNPDWSEEIAFTELFPPLARRIRIHIRESSGVVIATTFLDLSEISDNSDTGYMPLFGPAYLNLYGSWRPPNEEVNSVTLYPILQILPHNYALAEGAFYRGRLLVSVHVDLERVVPKRGLTTVVTKSLPIIPMDAIGAKNKFLLFCCIQQANMIQTRWKDKELTFRLCFGPHGQNHEESTANGDQKGQRKMKDLRSVSQESLLSAMEMQSQIGVNEVRNACGPRE